MGEDRKCLKYGQIDAIDPQQTFADFRRFKFATELFRPETLRWVGRSGCGRRNRKCQPCAPSRSPIGRVEIAVSPQPQEALHVSYGKNISDLRTGTECARPERAENGILAGVIRNLLIRISSEAHEKLLGDKVRGAFRLRHQPNVESERFSCRALPRYHGDIRFAPALREPPGMTGDGAAPGLLSAAGVSRYILKSCDESWRMR
jgi:hypothetical protein